MLSMFVPTRETGRYAEGRTTYEEVPLARCVEAVLDTEGLGYKCPLCRCDVVAIR